MEKEMLRRIARFVAPIAATALLATACGVGTDGDDGGDAGEPRSDMVLGTGSVGGTYYPLGGAIAQMWSSEIDDLRVSTISTGASVENIRLLQAGDINLAMSVNGTATQAVNGEGEFADSDVELAMLGNIYPEVMQIVASADSGIETIADLDGMRVAIGPDGSGTQILTQQILDAAGVTPGETFADGFGDAAAKLRDGQVDAAFGILALPAASLEEAAQNADLSLVSIPDDVSATLTETDATLSTMEIPGGTYPGIDDPATTVTGWATLYALPSLNEDQVYELVSTMYGNAGTIDHSVAASIQLETALEGRVDVELHPGAERYFEEQGLL
ncbi:TAXI family TRAP transporter solute-binding subunit [Glycomyces sp. L485]|uniref:TAXI family TRAP transporter solute-binding subunit n=1 Tax=Glycomyces sp. L485 TaxID=2909235 RepID=UPI001F4AECAE|nr:TAXI family TRAP transporter solute-binding subunit [Glycomyces sp. L485]MCH7231950.1 TAXI family TRAP transporter solute-binding subunit [Glycomyces sp. L485]